MAKMRIRFTKNAHYPQVDPTQTRHYEAGQEYDLEADHARRWLRRNVAVLVSEEVPDDAKSMLTKTKAPETKPPEGGKPAPAAPK